MFESSTVLQTLVERLAPSGDDPTSERIWRFSERMATIYEQQMEQFDEDKEARQWRQLYSADSMPPPDDTLNMAQVAAQMAFYFPTHLFKFQKAAIQQLLEWQSKQAQVNPYPIGAPSITLIDIGSGVGTASLAIIDLLATWTDMIADLGYTQLGVSVKPIVVESDINKQVPRRAMLGSMSSLLDRHSINIEQVTEVLSPYPEPDCIQQVLGAVRGGSLTICCMSNFLSSMPAGTQPAPAPLAAKAVECAEASRYLIANLAVRNRLLLASEVDEQGSTLRSFARTLHPWLEMLVRRNRVRFYSPPGCYWHSLQGGEKPEDPDCAVNFWSLAHWAEGNTSLLR